MRTAFCVVIGAGAAGISAAISCRRKGGEVLILERLSKPGKKILASGGGRCNLLNDTISAEKYNAEARELAAPVFARYGKTRLVEYFKGLGLEVYSDEGRIFPVTNQSASVLSVLELELARLAVPIEYNFEVAAIARKGDGYSVVAADNTAVECRKVVIAGGGKSYPALGSNGSCYRLARALGHSIVDPVPSCVAVLSRDKLCHHLQGQRIVCRATAMAGDVPAASAGGELIFTQYGLSGTAVLDVSTALSVALHRQGKKAADLRIDLVPFMSVEALETELARRVAAGFKPEELLIGILPNKFGPAMADMLRSRSPGKIARAVKERRFEVIGTRGWNEAEFTSGGVTCAEVEPANLESKFARGVHLCGELLDVNGERGGYNLAWAWASGLLAGEAASS